MNKKVLYILTSIVLFAFASCTNYLAENINNKFQFELGSAGEAIGRTVEANSNVTDNTELTAICELFKENNKIETSAQTVAVKDLASTTFGFKNVVFGKNYYVSFKILYKDIVIYNALSNKMTLDADNADVSIDLDLTPIYSKITYELDGGMFLENLKAPSKYFINSSLLIPTPEKQHYVFDGWYTSKEHKPDTKITKLGKQCFLGDVTLYAKWTVNPITSPTISVVPDGIKLSWVNPDTQIAKVVITDASDSTFKKEVLNTDLALTPSTKVTYTITNIATDKTSCKFRIKAVTSAGEESSLVSFKDITLPTASQASIETTNEKGCSNAIDNVLFTMSVNGTFGEGFSVDSFTVDTPTIDGDTPTVSFANSKATINLKTPETAGTFAVNLTYAGRSITQSFTVREYELNDIVYSDGSVAKTNITGLTPVAVIYQVEPTTLGIGIKESDSQLSWTISGSAAYTDPVFNIISKPTVSGTDGSADSAEFTQSDDDTCGDDNWNSIKILFSDEATALEQCPAFKWVHDYGTSTATGLKNTAYEGGWYMPSIKEMCDIYKRKDALNAAFAVVGEQSFTENEWYWSSSQSDGHGNHAWLLSFTQKHVGANDKSQTNYVRCIRMF